MVSIKSHYRQLTLSNTTGIRNRKRFVRNNRNNLIFDVDTTMEMIDDKFKIHY